MAKDDPLLDPLKTAAAASIGRIEFQARALRELGPELGIDLNSFTRPSDVPVANSGQVLVASSA